MKRIRVLVVDDSATMRNLISTTLRRDPEIEVIGGCGDPYEAREAIKTLSPDVITLDVEMPKMTGIEFLDKIMRLRPMPVIMVSTLTQAGAAITLEALEIGAFDCVGKPDFEHLAEKVKAAAASRVRSLSDRQPVQAWTGAYAPGDKIIAVGSSTGGVEALITMLQSFPANCPPTLITQHMPATFTTSFAARLDRLCAPHVAEATDGAAIRPGCVYLAPGGAMHLEAAGVAHPVCRLRAGDPVNGHRPSVDVLFDSVAKAFGARAVGIILTGMGKDGAHGMKRMRDAGAHTIGQDEASCIVYGMPKAAFEIGAVVRQLPLDRIARAALEMSAANVRGAA
ncbi:MAG: chemotaxis response regulator protein-glutamate methylesterase [Hydrogenophilaceae bacterium]|jgi:two-component system chemotaxis response regulator CheB|nr:chemotaxis response regulator protein-glutamate methylesterase [Hydrogenophilaceae bacterium]